MILGRIKGPLLSTSLRAIVWVRANARFQMHRVHWKTESSGSDFKSWVDSAVQSWLHGRGLNLVSIIKSMVLGYTYDLFKSPESRAQLSPRIKLWVLWWCTTYQLNFTKGAPADALDHLVVGDLHSVLVDRLNWLLIYNHIFSIVISMRIIITYCNYQFYYTIIHGITSSYTPLAKTMSGDEKVVNLEWLLPCQIP